MTNRRLYRVNEVAKLSGVSVRALHHYDAIGLLSPRSRTSAGYRVYDEDDLLRLQQILIGRALGLALEDIRRSLDDPRFDRRAALLRQRAELERRVRHGEAMLRAIDAALTELEPSTQAGGNIDMKAIFDGFDPSDHEAELEARWGETRAYREAAERSKHYSASDWKKFAAEQLDVYRAAAEALTSGEPSGGPAACDIAERHRLLIDHWFYPCSHAMHLCLADMYEHDGRFAAAIDVHGAGLTRFLCAAMRANAQRHAG